jgi:hypothetical protein
MKGVYLTMTRDRKAEEKIEMLVSSGLNGQEEMSASNRKNGKDKKENKDRSEKFQKIFKKRREEETSKLL